MTIRYKYTTLLTAGVIAAAVMSAPVASARPSCQEAGVTTICQTTGSVSIKAVPGTRAPDVSQVTPGGRGRR